jgi:arylsulfatase A-like enzyme
MPTFVCGEGVFALQSVLDMNTQPNVLWICTDQQRFDTIAALGNPHVSTPNIDRLVAEGVTFDHAYCQSPICTPSRASFLTGVYPGALHWTRNGNQCAPCDHPALVTRLLHDRGYTCGNIGKLHLTSAYGRVEERTDDGYTYWEYSHAPRDDWPRGHGYADWVREKGFVLGDLIGLPEGVPSELHQTTWCAEKTIEFIMRDHEGPWLASVNIYDPHPPFNPPEEYRKLFVPDAMPGPLFRESDLEQQRKLAGVDFQSEARRPDDLDIDNRYGPEEGRRDARVLQAAYYAMIRLIDDQVGRIVTALEESGQRESTVIMFMSDHGETLGDHGLIQKGCRFYEGLVRVPLIISWPGRFRAGLVSRALVELTDIAPTLLALAGMRIPDGMQGLSLIGILNGASSPDDHRDFVRSEYFDALQEPDGSFATMYRDRRYKLVVYHGHGLGELYDLDEDPGEFVNLWDDPAHREARSDLALKAFDAAILGGIDVGSRRIGPM